MVEQDRVMKVVAVELVDIVHLFQVVEKYFYLQDQIQLQLVLVDQDPQVVQLHHVLMEVYHQSLI